MSSFRQKRQVAHRLAAFHLSDLEKMKDNLDVANSTSGRGRAALARVRSENDRREPRLVD